MSNNVRTVNERDDINVIKYIMSINSNLAKLNSKVDGFNDAVKVVSTKADEAQHTANSAYDLAQKDKYEIDDLRDIIKDQHKEIKGLHKEFTNYKNGNKDSHKAMISYILSGVSMIVALCSGFIGNFVH